MLLLALILEPTSYRSQDQHFAKGIELQNQGKIEQAIEQYELSIKSRPQFPVLANLGAAYARLGRYTEAIDRYEQALKLAPGQPSVLVNLGLAYYKLGDLQKAVTQFDQALKSDPSNHQARTLQADCFFQMGDAKHVIKLLEPIWDKNTNDLSIAYLLGTAYIRDGQVDKGQLLVDRILRNGDSAEARLMLGTARAEAYDNKGALSEFAKAVELNPNLPMAHSSLGKALLQSGDIEAARAEFEAELKINPNDFAANFQVGLLRRRENQLEEAMTFLRKALALRPEDIGAAFEIGVTQLQKGELDEAQKMFEGVATRTPDFIDVHVNLARVYYRKKLKGEGDKQQEIVERLRIEQQKREPGSKKDGPH